MQFYKIIFGSFPSIRFAHTVRPTQYKNIITYRKNLIEFSLSQGSDIRRTFKDGSTLIIPSESFSIVMPDMDMHLEAIEKEKPLYMSNLVLKGKYQFEQFDTASISDIDRFLTENKDYLLLPVFLPLYSDYTEIEQLFRLAIMHYLKNDAAGQAQALSGFLEVAARINTLFRQTLIADDRLSYGDYYSNKIKSFILNHYYDKISVSSLAKMLAITPNYLSKVFKKSTGKSITEFITITRLYHARRLAYEGSNNVEEISKKVGICNANYLNLLFKRYYGTNLHDCLLADRELSLFHDKPWELEILTEDVQKE